MSLSPAAKLATGLRGRWPLAQVYRARLENISRFRVDDNDNRGENDLNDRQYTYITVLYRLRVR